MKLQKYLAALLAAACLISAGAAQAELLYTTNGDVLLVWGKPETDDIQKFKKKLTPSIKTIVLTGVTNGTWELGRDLGAVIEDAKITTVIHGFCGGYACPMMFLSGKVRMFSGAGRPEVHRIEIPFMNSARTNWTYNGISATAITEWWRKHTDLSDGDMREYHESVFVPSNYSLLDYLDFFPATAKFSKGNVLHCSGEKFAKLKFKSLADCMPVNDATALNKGIVTTDALFVHPSLVIKTDIVPPPPSKFAALEDKPAASVKLTDECAEIYERFFTLDSPRAFVVSDTGGCQARGAQVFQPYSMAMAACKKASTNGVCRFYAVDNEVVFVPFGQPLPESVPDKTVAN